MRLGEVENAPLRNCSSGQPWRVSRKKPGGMWAKPRGECGTKGLQFDCRAVRGERERKPFVKE